MAACAVALGCRAGEGEGSRTPSPGAASTSAQAIDPGAPHPIADADHTCTLGLGERASVLPNPINGYTSVSITLPAGLRAIDLMPPPPASILNPPRVAIAETIRGKRFAIGCGRTIARMAVGAVDDDRSEEMPEFVVRVLREELAYPAGVLEQVKRRDRTLSAVVRSDAAEGSDHGPLWVFFERPDPSCKVFFVVIEAPEADFAALLPMFQAATRSLWVRGKEWGCRPRGGGGGVG